MSTRGFALIWALFLAFILAVIAVALVNTSVARSRSTELKVSTTLAQIGRENSMAYASRLLVANADDFLHSAAQASSPSGSAALDTPAAFVIKLQAAMNALCSRNADGLGGTNRIRVYVTGSACGQPLPGGVVLSPPVLRQGQNSRILIVPFVLDVEDQTTSVRGHAIRSGELSVAGGPGFVSEYAFDLQRSGTLSYPLTVNGPAYVSGILNLVNSNLTFNGGLTISGCSLVMKGCSANPLIQTDSQTFGATELRPAANELCLPGKCITGAITPGAGDPIGIGTTGTITTTGNLVQLGVTPDNRQRIVICSGNSCREYQTFRSSGNTIGLGLLQSDGTFSQTFIPWDGIISFNGDITVQQLDASLPAVAARFTVRTTGNITVASNLDLTDPSCATGVCGATQDSNMLGLVAGQNLYTNPGVTDIMAAISAYSCVRAVVPVRILGSLACTLTPTGTVTVAHDPRFAADQNLAPPGLPALADNLRMTQVVFR